METYHTPENQKIHPAPNHRPRRVIGGLFIVAIGAVLLARQAGVDFPGWLFSFKAALIALGVYLGIRHSFRGFGWLIPIIIGSFLLVDDFFPEFDLHNFTWPLIIIGFGLFVIFRGGRRTCGDRRYEYGGAGTENTTEDYLDSVVVFGGVKKNIISKNFQGGEAVTVFGGTEINLTQADLTGVATLELTQVFGGTKLIVPANWTVQSREMVTIFGGIDDKRPPIGNPDAGAAGKMLILKGTCLLGGIDIRSY